MKSTDSDSKITAKHLARKAVVYLRQSSIAQVRDNVESQRLQYSLKDTAKAYGFAQVEVIDVDLGISASSGAQVRQGFKQLLASIALGEVGIVLSREPSRRSRRRQGLGSSSISINAANLTIGLVSEAMRKRSLPCIGASLSGRACPAAWRASARPAFSASTGAPGVWLAAMW